jgi:hypothetical protein
MGTRTGVAAAPGAWASRGVAGGVPATLRRGSVAPGSGPEAARLGDSACLDRDGGAGRVPRRVPEARGEPGPVAEVAGVEPEVVPPGLVVPAGRGAGQPPRATGRLEISREKIQASGSGRVALNPPPRCVTIRWKPRALAASPGPPTADPGPMPGRACARGWPLGDADVPASTERPRWGWDGPDETARRSIAAWRCRPAPRPSWRPGSPASARIAGRRADPECRGAGAAGRGHPVGPGL